LDILVDFYNFRPKVGRKNKYNLHTYINYIFRVFFFGETWETLSCPKSIKPNTIKKKFYLWDNNGIFYLAYDIMFNKFCNKKKFKKLFIDSTCIQNLNCSSQFVSYYHKIKSKKQVKLSIIATADNVPISYILTNPTVHDSKFDPIIKKLQTMPIRLANNSKLIGDKGYIRRKKFYKVNNKKITLITPKRKNQKTRNNKKNNELLNERYTVEQTFSHIKRTYKRLQLIYDRNINRFETFIIMAITCQIIRKI
jgi:hypothetical protein